MARLYETNKCSWETEICEEKKMVWNENLNLDTCNLFSVDRGERRSDEVGLDCSDGQIR